jgi:hypothetical protein
MTKYKFEDVDTSSSPNAEDIAYALIAAFGALLQPLSERIRKSRLSCSENSIRH